MAIADSGQNDNAGSKKDGLSEALNAALDQQEAAELSSFVKNDEKGPKETVETDDSSGMDEPSEDAKPGKAELPESEDESLSAPKHWPEADRTAFGRLPREAQEILLRKSRDLEGGFTRKSQELSDRAKFADTLRGLIDETTRVQLRTAGLDEAGYFRYLHSLQQEATRDPVGYIKMAMQALGVTPEKIGWPSPPPPASSDDDIAKLLADPKVAQLESRVQQLQEIIDREQQQRALAIQARTANVVNTLNAQIQEFRESLDENGHLKYPHFDAVRKHMAALMETDPDLAKLPDGADKLQKAYDMAVWARPDLRQSLVEAEAQRKLAEAQKRRDAERAKKVAGIKPAAGVISTKPKAKTLEDALSEAMNKAGF